MRRLAGSLLSRAFSIVLSFVLCAGTTVGQLAAAPAAMAAPVESASVAARSGAATTASSKPNAPAKKKRPAPTVVRELTEKRTASSEQYLMSDGSRQTKLYSGPVRFRNAAGQWREIARELVAGEKPGDLVAASLPVDERFGDIGGTRPAAEISTEKWSVGMDLIGALPTTKLGMGDTVLYPGIAKNTSLEYQTSATGMKDTLILASADAPSTFQFKMTIKGLELQTIPGQGPALFGSDSEKLVMTFGKLRVFDSSKKGAAAVCNDAKVHIVPAPGGALVTYTVPESWLKAPERVFPVRIDPSMNISADFDTFVHSVNNEGEQQYNHWLLSGYDEGNGECYSLLYFDTSPLRGAIIDSATLSMCVWSGNVGSKQVVAKNLDGWDPSIIYSDGLPSSTAITSATVSASDYLIFNVTGAVQDWSRGIGVDNGFQLYSASPGDESKQVGYGSSEANDPDQRPVLTVSYPAPSATTAATGTATGLGWYQGGAVPNDQAGVGRGRVALSWPAVSNSTGYKVMGYDGSAWRQVGSVPGSATTSWDSEAAGLFPADSTIASMPANNASNAFVGAVTPGATSMITSKTITPSGMDSAGLVQTDGTYLYVRRYLWANSDVTSWRRIGTGFNGTTAGQDYGVIGGDLSGRGSRSAFLSGGILWNGFTNSPSQLEGYSLDTGTDIHYKTFSKPFLNMWSGQDAGWYSPSVLVAGDSTSVYSLAMTLGDGNDWGGFKVRVYGTDGTWGADHNLAMRSYNPEGLISDGSNLYIIGNRGDTTTLVTKVRLSDWKVTNQFTLDQSNGQAPGCYDSANKVFWLGQEWDFARFYCYQAPGLDMRDDPRGLYSRMSGAATTGTDPRYYFKVVPYNADSSADIAACPTATVTLPKRTVGVNDDPRHATYGLGAMHSHDAYSNLERGSLELDVTDLEIKSWGPEASLRRHYGSSLTTATSFGPGWRFSFERSLNATGGIATYTDETGDAHRFVHKSGVWVSPNGMVSTLTSSGGVWTLAFKGGSCLTFNSSGVLTAETDEHNNTVTYARAPGHLYITAANGQIIDVSMTGLGVVTRADYATAAGTRRVLYNGGLGYPPGGTFASVFVYTNGTGGYSWDYRYGNQGQWGAPTNVLAAITFVGAGFGGPWTFAGPSWFFGFDGSSRLNHWQLEGTQYSSSISYSGSSATVNRPYGSSQTLSWNPDNTLASRTAILDASKSWSWVYGPTQAEIFSATPLGHTVASELDGRDNVLCETDERGSVTRREYDSLDREIKVIDSRGATTTRAYEGANLISETKSLTTTQSARTEWSRNTSGTVTQERQRVSDTVTATTDYSNFAPSGEAQTTINRGVKRAINADPEDLTSSKSYDAFGNLIWEKNAANQWVVKNNTYSLRGNLLTSEVVTGTITTNIYGPFGRKTGGMTQAGGVMVDGSYGWWDQRGDIYQSVSLTDAQWNWYLKTDITRDAEGRPTLEYSCDVDGVGFTGSAKRYDAAGNTTREFPQSATILSDVDHEELATRTDYDAENRATSVTLPGEESNPTVTTYSAAGLVTRVDNSDGSWETRTYDSVGNQLTSTKSKVGGGGATTTNTYDLGNRLVGSTDASGNSSTYGYDLAGRQISAGVSGRPSSQTTYNTLGWVLATTDADGIVSTKTYDMAGRETQSTVGGKTTTSSYDPAGRLLSRTDPSGATVHYEYDAFSRQNREWHESAAGQSIKDVRTAYDYASRVTDTSRTVGPAITEHTTFTKGQVSGLTLGYGQTTSTISYSVADGSETSRQVAVSGASSLTRTISAYDARKRATNWTVTGGLSSTGSRDFNGGDHLVGQSGTGLSSSASYTYGIDGRKSLETLPFSWGGTVSSGFLYNADGRLVSATASGYGLFQYDSSGNVATYTATVNGSGATTSGVLAYGIGGRLATRYASNGTTVRETYGFDTTTGWRTSQKRSGESSATFGYDNAGHLISYTKPANSQGTTYPVNAAYTYDALGQRSVSRVTTGSITTTTTWVYDGLKLYSLSATNSLNATWSVTYLYDQEDRPFAGVYRVSGVAPTEFGIVTTDRGDVVALTDSAGTTFAAYRYDAWGRPLSVASRATAIPAARAADIANRQALRYAGYCFDSESGLYYLSARSYDPATMQFLQKDAAKADAEESAYQYCTGDPVGASDPTGLHKSRFGGHWHVPGWYWYFVGEDKFWKGWTTAWTPAGKRLYWRWEASKVIGYNYAVVDLALMVWGRGISNSVELKFWLITFPAGWYIDKHTAQDRFPWKGIVFRYKGGWNLHR